METTSCMLKTSGCLASGRLPRKPRSSDRSRAGAAILGGISESPISTGLPPSKNSRGARAHTHTHTPGQNKEWSQPSPVCRGRRGRATKGRCVQWRCGDRQTDAHALPPLPGRRGRAADARGRTGRGGRQGGHLGMPRPRGLLRCFGRARATRVASLRWGPRGRAAGRARGARSAQVSGGRQVSGGLGSPVPLSPPRARPAHRLPARARPRPRRPARAPARPREPLEAGTRPHQIGRWGRARDPGRPRGKSTRRPRTAGSPSLPAVPHPPGLAVQGLDAGGGRRAPPASPVTYFVPGGSLGSPSLQWPAPPRLSLN